MHIVVVDGSRTSLLILKRLLEPRGDRLSLFTDGLDALDFLRRTPDVDVLITSFELTSLPGAELCWEARVLADGGRALYVIAMSANNEPEHVIGILDAGADDFMLKPPRVDELNARLRVAERTLVMQRRLIEYATIDALSGILNRRAFWDRTNRALHGLPPGGALSMILFDIDHFKRINDVYGHDVGDEVIRITGRLRVPPDAIFGRVGGEEFGLVLPDVGLGGAVSVAEHLREQIARLVVDTEADRLTFTASFGVGAIPLGGQSADLYRHADAALYHAKNSGRNRVSTMTAALVA